MDRVVFFVENLPEHYEAKISNPKLKIVEHHLHSAFVVQVFEKHWDGVDASADELAHDRRRHWMIWVRLIGPIKTEAWHEFICPDAIIVGVSPVTSPNALTNSSTVSFFKLSSRGTEAVRRISGLRRCLVQSSGRRCS